MNNRYFEIARGNSKSSKFFNEWSKSVESLLFDEFHCKQQGRLYDKIIFNKPATIVYWNDNTKTIVKSTKGDNYNPQFGFLMAYFQKHCGMTKTQCNKLMDIIETIDTNGGILEHD